VRTTFRYVLTHVNGAAGLFIVTVMVLAAVLAPLLAPYDPGALVNKPLLGPSAAHWLGTDSLGRDVLSRLMWGARSSLTGGVLATLIAIVVAVPVGITAGYFRGWWDTVVMRATDVSLAFPFIVLAVWLAAALGPSLTNAALVIGISQMPQQIRIARGETLALREMDYVTAAQTDGGRSFFIMRRHVLPNVMNTVVVQAALILPFAIITLAMLSFLGLGVQPPTADWGVMLTQAQTYASKDLLLAVVPGLTIFLAAVGFNLLGDSLRDALDPRGRR
jgi:peptide/nickel transport system permease protein